MGAIPQGADAKGQLPGGRLAAAKRHKRPCMVPWTERGHSSLRASIDALSHTMFVVFTRVRCSNGVKPAMLTYRFAFSGVMPSGVDAIQNCISRPISGTILSLSSKEDHNGHDHGEWNAASDRHRTGYAAALGVARRDRSDRHEVRLRHSRMRRLHGAH